MKHGNALAIGTLALALAACGGGNSHHDTDNTTPGTVVTTPGTTNLYRIEAVINDVTVSGGPNSGGTVNPDPGYRFQDLQNLELRDSVTFQLVYYTGSGSSLVRNVAATAGSGSLDGGVSFSTDDARSLAGSLTPNDGSFAASSNAVGPYNLTASFGGSSYTASYLINPRQIRLHGAVVTTSDPSNPNSVYQGVYNAQIDFYEVSSTQSDRQVIVQTVHTAEDGTFRASVPLPVSGDVRFVVRPPTGYSTTFNFPGTDFTPETSPTSDQIFNEFPSVASTLAPNGTYASGDFYLVPGTDISTSTSSTGSTFSFLTADAFNNDSGNLIVLSSGTTASSLKKTASKKKS